MSQYRNLTKFTIQYQNIQIKYPQCFKNGYLYNPRTNLKGHTLEDILQTNSKEERESFFYAFPGYSLISLKEFKKRNKNITTIHKNIKYLNFWDRLKLLFE